MRACKCSMTISVLGDGCRYCQPQEYIDRLSEMLDEERAEAKAQEPVSEVSEETFSSDGTSDIITHNLPIGTKLYAAPVAKQVVMPELSEIISRFPEINMANYGDDEVSALNNWGIELVLTFNAADHTEGGGLLDWAVDSWHAEVSLRPLVNVHRRALDGTWRQVIRRLGADDRDLCGPTHDEMMAKQGGQDE